MIFDIMLILKALWAVLTCVLLGALKIFYSDFKKGQDSQAELEKEVIRLRGTVVTKDSIDAILDHKIRHLAATISDVRADITGMRIEAKEENNALRREIRSVLNAMLDVKNR